MYVGEILVDNPGAERVPACAVRPAVEYGRRGLSAPAAVRAATACYRTESDPLGEFIAEACIAEAGRSATARELYEAYRRWAKSEAFGRGATLTPQAFGRRMSRRFSKVKTNGRIRYQGIGLRGEMAPASEHDREDWGG